MIFFNLQQAPKNWILNNEKKNHRCQWVVKRGEKNIKVNLSLKMMKLFFDTRTIFLVKFKWGESRIRDGFFITKIQKLTYQMINWIFHLLVGNWVESSHDVIVIIDISWINVNLCSWIPIFIVLLIYTCWIQIIIKCCWCYFHMIHWRWTWIWYQIVMKCWIELFVDLSLIFKHHFSNFYLIFQFDFSNSLVIFTCTFLRQHDN